MKQMRTKLQKQFFPKEIKHLQLQKKFLLISKVIKMLSLLLFRKSVFKFYIVNHSVSVPSVTAKSWIIMDGYSGKTLYVYINLKGEK